MDDITQNMAKSIVLQGEKIKDLQALLVQWQRLAADATHLVSSPFPSSWTSRLDRLNAEMKTALGGVASSPTPNTRS